RDVFLVPRLLAHEHQVRVRRPLAEDRLRRVAPEVAPLAVLRGSLERRQPTVCGHPRGGGRLRRARGHAGRVSTAGPTAYAFRGRLRKNARHLGRWAARNGLTAWRVYDRDVPEYPFVIERYGPAVHLVEYPRRAQRATGGHPEREAVLAAVVEVLQGDPGQGFTKTHLPPPW